MLPLVPASLSWDWYLFCGSVGKRFAVILRHALLGAICTVAQGWGVTPDLSMLSPMAATRMAGEVGMASNDGGNDGSASILVGASGIYVAWPAATRCGVGVETIDSAMTRWWRRRWHDEMSVLSPINVPEKTNRPRIYAQLFSPG